jgi:uncharacterized membrane protein YccC
MKRLKWILCGVALTPLLTLYGCIGMGGQSGMDVDLSILDNTLVQILIGVGVLWMVFRSKK